MKKGLEQGKTNKAMAIAKKMFAIGMPVKEVSELTDLPENELVKLLEQ